MTPAGHLPRLVTSVAELRSAVGAARREGKRIGFVPTMGALHEGHLSLVRASKAECSLTVVSIFVNPTQFGPAEDFAKYPRTLESDLALLASCGADLAFVPGNDEMYPPGFAAWVEAGPVAEPLEGKCRPGHFRGVATVVAKLLNMVQPDAAYFGRKDYQQTLVVRRMAADLNLPVQICVCPTVREPDGLAMSSRNRYLDPKARQDALALWRALCLARDMVGAGERDAEKIADGMRDVIQAVPGARIEYVTLADPETLQPASRVDGPTIALLAVRIGGTRLIDNELLVPPSPNN